MNTLQRFLSLLLLVGGLVAVLIISLPTSASDGEAFFVPRGAELLSSSTADNAVQRARLVDLNWDALQAGTAVRLKLNLFADTAVTAVYLRRDVSSIDGYVWVGQLEGHPHSEVHLSVVDDTLVGEISLSPLQTYRVRPFNGAHIIEQIDPFAPGPTNPNDTLQPPRFPSGARAAAQDTCRDDGSVVDVMVVYTGAAREALGGTPAMQSWINARISQMNTANNVSEVTFDINLVHTGEVDYAESGDFSTDLLRLLQEDDGYLDQVHALRTQHRADLVALIIAEGHDNICGMAYVMSEPADWFDQFAFGVTALDHPGPIYCHSTTLSHEFGHNFGNHHDHDHATWDGAFPYSHGYQSVSGAFRTIMAYDCPGGCPTSNYWSNPDVTLFGEPTGIDYAVDPLRAADNVESMEQVADIVANFRKQCELTPPTPTPTTVPTATPSPTATSTPAPTPTLAPSPTPQPTAKPKPTVFYVRLPVIGGR